MSMGNGSTILRAREVHKVYRLGKNKVHVLKGVDLEVLEGQIVAVTGPSGVGKSTLLHILGTLDRPSRGTVEIDDTNVFEFDEHQLARFRNRSIGFVFQFHHLLPEFTALENVMMPGLIGGHSQEELVNRAQALLYEVGLTKRLSHRPGELSGGEMQRVAVARALMQDPKLVLADEPSGNLDQATSQALHELLWQLSRKDERTFIIVTHNKQLAQDADKVIEISDGRISKEQLNQIV